MSSKKIVKPQGGEIPNYGGNFNATIISLRSFCTLQSMPNARLEQESRPVGACRFYGNRDSGLNGLGYRIPAPLWGYFTKGCWLESSINSQT